MAVDDNGSAIGWRMLPDHMPYFPQPEAADDPSTYDGNNGYDSCVGRLHY